MKVKWRGGDLSQRLDRTFIRYDDQVYYCRYAGPTTLQLTSPVANGSLPTNVSINDDKLDVSSLPLGYLQFGSYVYYLSRYPGRRYKQGVCQESLIFSPQLIVPMDEVLFSQGFVNMVEDKYPNMPAVIKAIKRAAPALAMSRETAIFFDADNKIYKVKYKQEEVGYINPEIPTVVEVPSEESSWVVSMYLSNFTWRVN